MISFSHFTNKQALWVAPLVMFSLAAFAEPNLTSVPSAEELIPALNTGNSTSEFSNQNEKGNAQRPGGGGGGFGGGHGGGFGGPQPAPGGGFGGGHGGGYGGPGHDGGDHGGGWNPGHGGGYGGPGHDGGYHGGGWNPGHGGGYGGPGHDGGYHGGGWNPHPDHGHGYGGVWGTPGWHEGGPRPGWYEGWRWHEEHEFPYWWRPEWVLPLFVFVEAVEPGYWQCTAFDQYENPFSAAGPDRDSAAYNALYDCGGDDYQDTCFIPAGYCNIR